jgi:hypothetical protein
MAGAAEETWSIHAERRERIGEFGYPVTAQLVGVVDGELGISLSDHLTFFTERAGDHANVRTAADVMSDGAAGGERLVVRMGVDEQQARDEF